MEKKYKLEYIQTFDILDNKITKIILFFIWLIVVVFLIIVSISSPDISFLILLLAFAYSCMFGMILLIIYLPPRNNKNYEYKCNCYNDVYILFRLCSNINNSFNCLFNTI